MQRDLGQRLVWWLTGFLGSLGADEGFFDSDGVKIHYLVRGRGEPVLLIHGFALNVHVQWGSPGIMRALAKEYQVIAPDNRGHGRSDRPHDPGRYGAEMVEDAVRLLDHLKIDKAHVVGYSMGARITCRLLVTYPDRLLTATLGGGGGIPQGDAPRYYEAVAHSLEEGKGFGPLIEALTPAGQPKPTPRQVQQTNRFLEAGNDTRALAAVARGMKHLAVADDRLKASRVPTLALIGASDPLKKGVDDLAGRLANLQVVVIDGADHVTAFTRPQFLKELTGFLARHRRRQESEKEGPG